MLIDRWIFGLGSTLTNGQGRSSRRVRCLLRLARFFRLCARSTCSSLSLLYGLSLLSGLRYLRLWCHCSLGCDTCTVLLCLRRVLMSFLMSLLLFSLPFCLFFSCLLSSVFVWARSCLCEECNLCCMCWRLVDIECCRKTRVGFLDTYN